MRSGGVAATGKRASGARRGRAASERMPQCSERGDRGDTKQRSSHSRFVITPDSKAREHSERWVATTRRPLVWLRGSVKTPPFSAAARLEAGVLLRRLQRGDSLSMPHARPMPTLGARCGELRVPDAVLTWRILYRLDPDAVVIVDGFAKKTRATPTKVLATGRGRLQRYDRVTQSEG